MVRQGAADGAVHLGWATKRQSSTSGHILTSRMHHEPEPSGQSPPIGSRALLSSLGFRSLGLQTRRGLHSGVAAYYWVRGAVR